MGGQTSKFEVIENNVTNNGYGSVDSSDDENDCKCLPFWSGGSVNKKGRKRNKKKKEDLLGTPLSDTGKPIITTKQKIIMNSLINKGLFLERERSSATVGGLSIEKENVVESNNNSNNPYAADQITAEIHYNGKQLSDKYSLCEVLGVGSTSTCYRCLNLETGESYACKMIDKQFVAAHYQGMAGQFQSEILALKSLQHPNIISLYDVYVTSDKIYIVMELMLGGELFDYVVERGTLTESEAADIMIKVTDALVYMHSKNIIHRDLKPENLLLLRKPLTPNHIEVKIIDFGLSKRLETEPGAIAKSFLGTRGYLAPEMLQRQHYSSAVDTWALGVILYVLLCGCLPFDDDSQPLSSADALKARFILRYPRWALNLSSTSKDLLSHLLDIDPTTRYTAQRALNHQWMTTSRTRLKKQQQQPPQHTSAKPQHSHRRTRSHTNSTMNTVGSRQRSYSDQSSQNVESDDSANCSSHLGRSTRSRPRRVRKFHAKKSVDI